MYKNKRYLARLAVLLLISFLPATALHAHPHSWLDVKTTIEGKDNHITGFSMSWTFDAMTSFYMLDGQDLSEKNKAQTFKNITLEIMDNLVLEHYFTYFYDGETVIPYLPTDEGLLTQQENRLKLEFYIPLGEPKKLSNNPLKLQVYESTNYLDMRWNGAGDVQLSPELKKQCVLNLLEPSPTPQQVGYAMSLGQDETPDYPLGELFTQSLMVQCAIAPATQEEATNEK